MMSQIQKLIKNIKKYQTARLMTQNFLADFIDSITFNGVCCLDLDKLTSVTSEQ